MPNMNMEESRWPRWPVGDDPLWAAYDDDWDDGLYDYDPSDDYDYQPTELYPKDIWDHDWWAEDREDEWVADELFDTALTPSQGAVEVVGLGKALHMFSPGLVRKFNDPRRYWDSKRAKNYKPKSREWRRRLRQEAECFKDFVLS